HEGQAYGHNGWPLLFVGSQERLGTTCLMTAVDGEKGQVVWQRQLGLLNHGQPWAAGNKVFLRDVHALFVLDSENYRSLKESGSLISEKFLRIPLPADTGGQHRFLTDDKGTFFVAWSEQAAKLHICRLAPGQDKPV